MPRGRNGQGGKHGHARVGAICATGVQSDGWIDEGFGFEDDDEDGFPNEDTLDGIDNDGDGNIDEDCGWEADNDGAPGIAGIDDDQDGQVDDGGPRPAPVPEAG